MPRFHKIAVAAFSASLLISCERAAQSVPNNSQVTRQPQPRSAGLTPSEQAAPDSLVSIPGDTLVVTDTAGADFTPEDLVAVKTALGTRLHLDEFTASGPAPSYGNPCRFYDSTSVRRYATSDAHLAFVRPRLLRIGFVRDDNYVRLVSGTAEIVRLALAQRGADGKWYGAPGVTRDTVSLLVSSSVEDSTWKICEKPAHSAGWAGDAAPPVAAWVPMHAADAERMGVVWDDKLTIVRLAQIADSVSRLPFTHVVEGNPEPPMPWIYKDVCPGEGCEFGEWLTCDTLRVFAAADGSAKTAFVLHRGDRFTAVTGDVHVSQAGKVVFTRMVKLDGEEEGHFVFTPADTLYPLLYAGEGDGSWYFRGKESGGFFFFGSADQDATDIPVVAGVSGYVVTRPIKSEWWVRVREKSGREGWIRPHGRIFGMSPHYEEMPKACPA